jgi:hypothetical protein
MLGKGKKSAALFTPPRKPEITRLRYLFQRWKKTVEKVENLKEK